MLFCLSVSCCLPLPLPGPTLLPPFPTTTTTSSLTPLPHLSKLTLNRDRRARVSGVTYPDRQKAQHLPKTSLRQGSPVTSASRFRLLGADCFSSFFESPPLRSCRRAEGTGRDRWGGYRLLPTADLVPPRGIMPWSGRQTMAIGQGKADFSTRFGRDDRLFGVSAVVHQLPK